MFFWVKMSSSCHFEGGKITLTRDTLLNHRILNHKTWSLLIIVATLIIAVDAVDGHLWGVSQSAGTVTAADAHWARETEHDWSGGVPAVIRRREETQCELSFAL